MTLYWGNAVMKVLNLAKARWSPMCGYVRPMEAARELGISRLEAELALRLLVEWKQVGYRSADGRYYWIEEKKAVGQ